MVKVMVVKLEWCGCHLNCIILYIYKACVWKVSVRLRGFLWYLMKLSLTLMIQLLFVMFSICYLYLSWKVKQILLLQICLSCYQLILFQHCINFNGITRSSILTIRSWNFTAEQYLVFIVIDIKYFVNGLFLICIEQLHKFHSNISQI